MKNVTKISFILDKKWGGRGAWFLNRFVYFGKSFRRTSIYLARTTAKVYYVLALLSLLVVIGGWVAFFAWIYFHLAELIVNPWRLLFFWQTFDPLSLIFIISLWVSIFLVYRRLVRQAALKKINYKLWQKEPGKFGRKKYDVATAYSDAARRVIEDAYLLVVNLGQPQIEVMHLFRVLLRAKEIQTLFIRLNVDAKRLVDMVDRRLINENNNKIASGRPSPSPLVHEILVSAFFDAFELHQDSVDVLNIVLFCTSRDEILKEILYELEIDEDKIKNAVAWFRVNRRLLENYRNYQRFALLKPGNNMNRSYTAIATPTLDRFSRDVTVSAKFGNLDICIGRDKEIDAIFDAFTGGHYGVLLVGQPGTGKRTIVGGLAQLMVEENVPSFLKDKRLLELDVPRLVSGATPSEASQRLLICISEAQRSGNIILFIDNLENIMGISTGGQESLDLSEVLAEAISRQTIYCVATVNTEDYARYVEHKSIGNLMTMVKVEEPSHNAAIQMLESKVGFLENKYDIYIVYDALDKAVTMSARYLSDQALPLKAFHLLEKAVIMAVNKPQTGEKKPKIFFCSGEEVAAAVSEMTGIPVEKVTAPERQKLLTLEQEIHKRLIGQVEAVEAVAASLRRARASLKDSKRPIASFLFLGPTGVGKTELAKSVSEVYFGDEDYLVRIDMSEYQAPDSIRKMIGDVDGTLGYLTEAVRKKPFSLILFDEIEKANPDILNLFLQLLDDGRLTDGQGRTINFSESIIISTSNIGAVYIQEQIKAGTPLNLIKQELIDNQLNKHLRPELINRFDGIIVFKPLDESDIIAITTLMLKKIKKNLAESGINLKADKDGAAILAKAGYDPKFGARPLRRLLQDRIENDIANRLLAGELKRRDTVIINSRGEIEIEKADIL